MSRYLTIRADARHSAFAATSPLVAFLATLPELRKTGPVAFEAAEGQPWVAVIMTVCSPEGTYASGGAYLPQVNVVELVCSDAGDPAWYDALAVRIAEFLGWSAFEDHEERQLERLLDGRRER